MRQQFHSCDQCRKSKRACDAPLPVSDQPVANISPQSSIGSHNPASQPCSYCLKTRKTCTVDWAIRSRRNRRHTLELVARDTSAAQNGQEDRNLASTVAQTASLSGKHLGEGRFPDFFDRTNDLQDLDFGTHIPHRSSFDSTKNFLPDFSETGLPSCSLKSSMVSTEEESQRFWNEPFGHAGVPENEVHDPVAPAWNDLQEGAAVSSAPYLLGSAVSLSRHIPHAADGNSAPFPSGSDQTLAKKATHGFISTGLLKIYHDVLENNLTCWLSEATCPYKSRDADVRFSLAPVEWGPKWSNRMYSRTIRLDRQAINTGLVSLTFSEDLACSRALSLSILAFASQWAQGSQRQREVYGDACHLSSSSSDARRSISPSITGEFDRNIQTQFWEQAHKALQEVSHLESFRVASAEILFGLTQRPFKAGYITSCSTKTDLSSSFVANRDLKSEVTDRLSQLMSTEGPPIYMERAARKMQALKSSFDSSSLQSCRVHRGCRPPKGHDLGAENRATLNLLYWLAVMFDTISSTMSNRPPVVCDQESQHHPPLEFPGLSAQRPMDGAAVERWSVPMFIRDNLHEPMRIPTWPCSDEDSANFVMKSAPIKVLLFRYISYIQGMIRNGSQGRPIDELIDTTISIYKYWETTYGSFFRCLVRDIDYIPFRIQGWFTCISAHWHLAALMLSDLIEFVDVNELATPLGTQYRVEMNTAKVIRDHTVKDLAELARVSTPNNDLDARASEKQSSHFHYAVNECVILTEPWTIILIRAFGMASTILLAACERSMREGLHDFGVLNGSLISNLSMAEECIKALWHLGKKSDLSRKSAEALSVALGEVHVSVAAVR